MDGAAAGIVPNHGEKPIEALSAFFNVFCPELGDIVIGDPTDQSGNFTQTLEGMINMAELADLSCDETKAGFQIHIYILSDLSQVT